MLCPCCCQRQQHQHLPAACSSTVLIVRSEHRATSDPAPLLAHSFKPFGRQDSIDFTATCGTTVTVFLKDLLLKSCDAGKEDAIPSVSSGPCITAEWPAA